MHIEQPNLFDTPERAKLDAIAQVQANANPDFLDCAYQVLCEVARVKAEFSARDVWKAYESDPTRPVTHQPRAMGPVFMRASKAGVIRATNRFVKSGRKSDHNQNLRVWVSLLNGGESR